MSRPQAPMAIVGMACLLPGARNEDELWSLLWEGRDAVTEMPMDRLDRDLYFHPDPGRPTKTYSVLAGLVPTLELDPGQLEKVDACHLILSDVAEQAWRQADLCSGARVGVYVGHAAGSEVGGQTVFADRVEEALRPFGPEFAAVAETLKRSKPQGKAACDPRQAARTISQRLDLHGPAVVIDAACASSLVALASAAMALEEGSIDCAVVAGASYAKGDNLVLFSQAHSCSANGSRPFDDGADGLVGSEGYVCLVVQRLDKALTRNAKVRAVIRGIGIASDGRGRSLWAPRVDGQCMALERAFQGLDPARIEYLEAHATSTQVGDATELEALAKFFGPHFKERKLPIGSIKSNLGHTLETAGLASLAKVVLAFERRGIPPSINIEKLNSAIDWPALPIEIVREARDWQKPGLAGVSAFGIGGLNVHVVLEPAPSEAHTATPSAAEVSDPVVLVGAGMVGEGIASWRSRSAGSRPRGRIKDYQFDGLELRIPPRLIERADPLGFMLLDAAGQALAGAHPRRSQTGVVVATSFGNLFSEQLQLGLRLPEILKQLRSGLANGEREAFEKAYLERYPALLDETGGFTPSSLASRIAKAFDLMGGAATLDSGAASSLEALRLAKGLLISGRCQAVLCCGGERTREHATEGAVALHLKLMSVARADGDRILGTLDSDSGISRPGPFGAAEGLCEVLLSHEPRPVSLSYHFGAETQELLESALQAGRPTGYSPSDRFRAAILAPDEATMAKRVHLAANMSGQPRSLEEQAVYRVCLSGRRPKVAFCFAGQGSQSEGMLQSMARGSAALIQADLVLTSLGLPTFGAMAWSGNPALDHDPVTTQVSLLVADWLMYQELEKRGLRADYVWGHSFGEFAALVAARVLTLEQALRLTRVRAEALARESAKGGLVSITANATTVSVLLEGTSLSITHCNSPEQTVVGGKISELALLELSLQRKGLDYRRLRVPGALHTELARPACESLRKALESEQFRPPDRLFVSNVGNRYATEPEEIKANLVEQLVEPVRYQALVERLIGDGVEVLVEVGPGRTLTALHRQIVGQAPVVLLSSDHPRREPHEQFERLELVFESLEPGFTRARTATRAIGSPPEDFDATENRRERRPKKGVVAATEGAGKWEAYVLDLVVDLTGYPREAIDLDWDLEADLGLDSIKQTALFGELADLTGRADAQTVFNTEFRTLRQVLGWLSESGEEPSPPAPSAKGQQYSRGLELGRIHRQAIRRWLRELAVQDLAKSVGAVPAEEFEKGVAEGAGVLAANLVAHRGRAFPWEESVTSRHVIRMREVPLPSGAPAKPHLEGALLVLGQGPLTDRLVRELGTKAFHARSRHDLADIKEPLPHLLITLSAEPEARTDLEKWTERRELLHEAYWTCQEWYRRLLEQGLIGRASVTAITRLGGDLGLSGQVGAAEGGAWTGLLKALAVENWVSGQPLIAMRTVDIEPETGLDDTVETILKELAVFRFDLEVCWRHGRRMIPWMKPQPLTAGNAAVRRPHGCWLFTGGAHGITAEVAYELWRRYDLKIHILGRTPAQDVNPAWRDAWRKGEKASLKFLVTDHARSAGLDPIEMWRDTEKALLLDETLSRLPGARYHSVDVGDGESLSRVLQSIRDQDGPIRGVIHGAGVGRDDRFDLKKQRWVEACFRAKLDGTVELMRATWNDPLDFFVAFGSISGRFGANGHTDYSLSNDMMAKLVDWYRSQRPEVAAVTFHWHAWGGVGMAALPSAQLALELVSLKHMPLQEGISHLINELEAGAPEPEVVITEPRQCRLRDPHDPPHRPEDPRPLLWGGKRTEDGWTLSLDPKLEPFLSEHRLEGIPVLPLAFSLEILAEATLADLPAASADGLVFEEIRADELVTFLGETARSLRVRTDLDGRAQLMADSLAGNGQAKRRVFCSARVRQGDSSFAGLMSTPDGPWNEVRYDLGGPMFHGPHLRGLKSWQLAESELWGRILVPPITYLLGTDRVQGGWLMPSSLLDGCFYAASIYHYVQGGHTALPRAMQRLEIGRSPQPGEGCLVRVRRREELFDFTVWGEDASTLLVGTGYQVSLVTQSGPGMVKSQ